MPMLFLDRIFVLVLTFSPFRLGPIHPYTIVSGCSFGEELLLKVIAVIDIHTNDHSKSKIT